MFVGIIQLAGHFRGKNFNIGDYTQTVQPFFFIPAILYIGTIDFYHFISFSLTLILLGGRKAKPIGFIFSNTFHLIRVKFDVVMKQFKLNIWRLLIAFE